MIKRVTRADMEQEMSATRDPEGFPPYAFIPGHRPHPTQHVDGHSYGETEEAPEPLDPANWGDSEAYGWGFALFQRGYYWEAHETWEGLWIAAGRKGAVGELLKGLIKLAAAGIKVRQGVPHQVPLFGERAGAHFRRAKELCGQDVLAGLVFTDLLQFSAYLEDQGSALRGSPDMDVEVVFSPERCPQPGGEPL